MRFYNLAIIMVLFSCSLAAQVKSYNSEQSLKPTNPLKCVDTVEVQNEDTAADIVSGALKCVKSRKYERAANLVMVASAYVYFDTLRVTDKSAHAAQQALFAEIFSNQSRKKMEKLFAEIDLLKPGTERHRAICEQLEQSGPPSYFPTYMIAHGMGAFLDNEEDPLVTNFDANSAWIESIYSFTNCEENSAETS